MPLVHRSIWNTCLTLFQKTNSTKFRPIQYSTIQQQTVYFCSIYSGMSVDSDFRPWFCIMVTLTCIWEFLAFKLFESLLGNLMFVVIDEMKWWFLCLVSLLHQIIYIFKKYFINISNSVIHFIDIILHIIWLHEYLSSYFEECNLFNIE